ncbi:MAG: PhzF family phenazine biosynthesis protein [Xanthomonadales bacterium]|nr:PhzF family phenazine biosynthesis protein [Xanthomonadales bacterium]
MSLQLPWLQLDVFSDRLFAGNPLAVVLDAGTLDAVQMQRVARWTNLSETAFLLPVTDPAADYHVRIFTPRQELPYAGHPSVGAAYAALDAGMVGAGKSRLVQQCAAGLLPVQVEGTGAACIIHVQAPAARLREHDTTAMQRLAASLGAPLEPGRWREVDNGPRWLVCDLGQAAVVRALHPDMAALAALSMDWSVIGACVFGREPEGAVAMAVRAFCPADGIPEDPVTGSANAAIAAYLQATGGLGLYGRQWRASQGREVGRDGYLEVRVDGDGGAISVGGACCIGVRGMLRLDAAS